MQAYQHLYRQVYSEVNNPENKPGNKLCDKPYARKSRLRFLIPARSCPGRKRNRTHAPPADPSLPTTEEGVSARGYKILSYGAGRAGFRIGADKPTTNQRKH